MTAAKGTTRPAWKRAWDFLGSRDLSVFIFVMGMTYFLILTVFATIIPLPGVDNISNLLPYKALYILFFVNLIICEIKMVPVIISKCRKPKAPETEEEMKRFGHKTVVSGQWSVVSSGLEKHLRRRGYSVFSGDSPDSTASLCFARKSGTVPSTPHSSLILYAYKGRFSPIGNLLFHLSFLFLLAGAGLGMFYRFEGNVSLLEGQRFTGAREEYASVKAPESLDMPRISFDVRKITPKFWKDWLLFVDLKADLSYEGGEGVVRLGQPLRIGGARVTITGLGITPLYILKDGQGRELDSGYVSLSIFTPGSEDHFQIPDTPYSVYVSFYPDHEFRNGRVFNRSMNPVNQVYRVKVLRGRSMVYQGFTRPGEGAVFDGLSLSFPEFQYAGLFRVVQDKGFVFIWVGFMLMVGGLMYRLMAYRREIVVYEKEGKTFVAGFSEYHRRFFDAELSSTVCLSQQVS